MGLFNRLLGGSRSARDPPPALQALVDLAAHADREGQPQRAAELYRQALALAPTHPAIHVNLAVLEKRRGDLDAALALLERAVEFDPGLVQAWYNLGLTHYERWRLADAERALWHALSLAGGELDPHLRSDLIGLQAIVLQSLGQPGRARAFLYEAAARFPAHEDECLRMALLPLCADPAAEPGELLTRHREWATRYADPLAGNAAPRVWPAPSNRLRLGYVSGDFCAHAVACFFEPVLAAHDRARFEIFCYDNSPHADDTSARLRASAEHWRPIGAVGDADVAALVRADGIDILVDLSGHTARNRLLVFARKPAPVQFTWLGYGATTGMRAFDYRITDAVADPPGLSETHYVERLIRLPAGQWCYRPSDLSPPAGRFPAVAGHVTFGVFNRMDKVTDFMIDLWAEVLAAVPRSRLFMRGVSEGEPRAALLARFVDAGCDPARIELRARVPASEYWGSYHAADIAFDTFPYNGVTTTCESLWMGIPVISLAGQFGVARCGASLLTTVGLAELVAATAQSYVRIAVELGRDPARLGALRQGLRDKMRCSPLMDARTQAGRLESTYLAAWSALRSGTPMA